MSESVIELRGLTKRFGRHTAVDGLDMEVQAGTVMGLLGLNGAGKTTTIRMLTGHLHPSEGEARVFGEDPRRHCEALRQKVGYVSENMDLPGWMTPEKAVRFNASLYPRWNHRLAEALLDEFALRGKGRYGQLSKGQKRKVCILVALCQDARLLIMDEPTSGLDVAARRDFLQRVLEIACDKGTTVILSSHLLTDIERVSDRIALIHEGKVIKDGHIEDLKAGVRRLQFAAAVDKGQLSEVFKVLRFEADTRQTTATVADFDSGRLNAWCEKADCTGKVQVLGLNLEDIFVEMVRGKDGEQEVPA